MGFELTNKQLLFVLSVLVQICVLPTRSEPSPLQNNNETVSVNGRNKRAEEASEVNEIPEPSALDGIPLNTQCAPSDETRQCVNLTGVKCLQYDGVDFSACVCDYFHTYYTTYETDPRTGVTKKVGKCFLNVFAPCKFGGVEEQCGENMACVLDTLRINNDKFCRCLPGFAPEVNALQIPAYCLKIIAEEEAVEEEEEEKGKLSNNSFNHYSNNFLIILLTELWLACK